ncbi:TPA: hypothetical protein ACXK4S_000691 [Pseudomonas aeruginosa]
MNINEKIEFQFNLELKALIAEADSHLYVYDDRNLYVPKGLFDVVNEKSMFKNSGRIKKSSSHRVYATGEHNSKIGHYEGYFKKIFSSHKKYPLVYEAGLASRSHKYSYGYCHLADILVKTINMISPLNFMLMDILDSLDCKMNWGYIHKSGQILQDSSFRRKINKIGYLVRIFGESDKIGLLNYVNTPITFMDDSLAIGFRFDIQAIAFGKIEGRDIQIIVTKEHSVVIRRKSEEIKLNPFSYHYKRDKPTPINSDLYIGKNSDTFSIGETEVVLSVEGLNLLEMLSDELTVYYFSKGLLRNKYQYVERKPAINDDDLEFDFE